MKVRLLPVAVLVATTLLGVKLTSLWSGVESMIATPAVAQSAKPVAAESAPAPQQPVSQGTLGAATQRPGEMPDDPALMSQAEIELLQRLAARRAEIESWNKDLELRETLLKAAEQRLDKKLGELKSVETSIKAMLKQHDAEQGAKLRSLVKIYETMKPKDAAVIFEKLDMAILLDVVEGMREQKVAPVIAAMDPDKAKTLTAEMAKRREIAADPAQSAEMAAAGIAAAAAPAQSGVPPLVTPGPAPASAAN